MHWRNFTATDANIAANDATIANQLIHNFVGQLEWDRKADALRRLAIVTFIERQGIDAH
ncbi:hypothetical protein D1872_304050 [compost metagenome]